MNKIIKEALKMIKRIDFKLNEFMMIVGLFLVVFVMGADSFIISPLLPAIAKDFNVSVGAVALAVTIYALCYALSSPFFGPLGDKFKQKNLLMLGILFFLIGSFLCAVSQNIYQFYCFRAIAGLGAALSMPNVWAIIGNHFEGKKLNIVMGIVMSALSLSIAVGVPLGTTLAQLANWHMAFWGSGILILLVLPVLLGVIPKNRGNSETALNYLEGFKNLWNSKEALWALSINLIWMFGFYTIYTFLGTYLHDAFNLNVSKTGYVFIVYGLSNFIASFFGGTIISKIGALKNIIINGILSSIFILGLSFYDRRLVNILIFLILIALTQGIGVTALTTYIVNVVPSNRSTVMSFNSSFLYWGLTLGSTFGSIFYEQIGFKGLGIFSSLLILLAVDATYRLNNRHKNIIK